MNLLYTFINTWAVILCRTLRIYPSWPRPRVRLSPYLAFTCLVPSLFVFGPPRSLLFVLTIHMSHIHPSLPTKGLNTFIQVNIMGTRYNRYNMYYGHIFSLQLFFLCLLLISGQAGWPWTLMLGTRTLVPWLIPCELHNFPWSQVPSS
jgi:hypothetical protein